MAEEDEAALESRDHSAYDVGRLLALSDGVFAIAMTLLVLGIPVPQLTNPTDQELLRALNHIQTNLAAFVLSFVLVGRYWITHHRMLRGLVRIDRRFVWLNLYLLLLVCVVPFSAEVLSRYGYLATAVIVYAVNLALLGVAALGLRLRLWSVGLLRRALSGSERRAVLINSIGSIAIFAISIPLALIHPTYAEVFWITLLPLGLIFGRREALR